jgi:hypothetical protein
MHHGALNIHKNIMNKHLQQQDTYKNLTFTQAGKNMYEMRVELYELLNSYENTMVPCKYDYFKKAVKQPTRIPQFYGTPKVHKNKFPIPFCPVVAQCGCLSAIISTFLDYKLQQFTKTIPSYILNSVNLLNQINNLNTLPPSA